MKSTTNILPKPSYCSFKFKIAVSLIQTVASVTESTKSLAFDSMTNMLLYISISIERRIIWNKIICCLWSCLQQREFNTLVLVFSAKLNYLWISKNYTRSYTHFYKSTTTLRNKVNQCKVLSGCLQCGSQKLIKY